MLNEEQIGILLQLTRSVTPDAMDCDHCLCKIAQFAEIELAGRTIPEAMDCVRNHLANCPCCHHEFEDLLAALRIMQDSNPDDAVPESADPGESQDNGR
jgi:predicted anti-sigma-YlaC factor YlaD